METLCFRSVRPFVRGRQRYFSTWLLSTSLVALGMTAMNVITVWRVNLRCAMWVTHTHTHPFNGPFPGLPGWASTRKVKPIWILLKQETVSGSGISWAVCKSAPRFREITTPASCHSVFTGQMNFLPPNQQRQSTIGTCAVWVNSKKSSQYWNCFYCSQSLGSVVRVLENFLIYTCCYVAHWTPTVVSLCWSCYWWKLLLYCSVSADYWQKSPEDCGYGV